MDRKVEAETRGENVQDRFGRGEQGERPERGAEGLRSGRSPPRAGRRFRFLVLPSRARLSQDSWDLGAHPDGSSRSEPAAGTCLKFYYRDETSFSTDTRDPGCASPGHKEGFPP